MKNRENPSPDDGVTLGVVQKLTIPPLVTPQ